MTLPKTMQAVEITQPGGPEVLRPTTVATPQPGRGEVLVRVAAAGVNRPDTLQRKGLYNVPADASPLPGLEIAGEIAACGPNATRWRPGDRVVALTHGGGYAAYCAVDERHCLPWPEGFSAVEAATLPETCFTVQYNLVTRAGLGAGESVLIHGGSSGIGSTAIQIAKALGARVLVTAGTPEKCRYCLDLGADHAIDYRATDWLAEAQSVSGAGGVDVVLDMVAGPYVAKNLQLLGLDGRYAMIAFLLGPKAEVDFVQVLSKRISITGSMLRPQTRDQKAAIADDCRRTLWPMIARGELRSIVHATFPLAEAARAHELMETSRHMGKIALAVAGD